MLTRDDSQSVQLLNQRTEDFLTMAQNWGNLYGEIILVAELSGDIQQLQARLIYSVFKPAS